MGRKLIETSTSYDPPTVQLLGRAFDKAWEAIADRYHDPRVVQTTREQLALAILHRASAGERDVEALAAGALMSLEQSAGPRPPDPKQR